MEAGEELGGAHPQPCTGTSTCSLLGRVERYSATEEQGAGELGKGRAVCPPQRKEAELKQSKGNPLLVLG